MAKTKKDKRYQETKAFNLTKPSTDSINNTPAIMAYFKRFKEDFSSFHDNMVYKYHEKFLLSIDIIAFLSCIWIFIYNYDLICSNNMIIFPFLSLLIPASLTIINAFFLVVIDIMDNISGCGMMWSFLGTGFIHPVALILFLMGT